MRGREGRLAYHRNSHRGRRVQNDLRVAVRAGKDQHLDERRRQAEDDRSGQHDAGAQRQHGPQPECRRHEQRFRQLARSEDGLRRGRDRVGQGRAEIDEVPRGPLAVQHLLRAGKMHIVIVGEAGQRQEPERRDQHEQDQSSRGFSHDSIGRGIIAVN